MCWAVHREEEKGKGVSQSNPQRIPVQNQTREEHTLLPCLSDVDVDVDEFLCPVFMCYFPGPWTDVIL